MKEHGSGQQVQYLTTVWEKRWYSVHNFSEIQFLDKLHDTEQIRSSFYVKGEHCQTSI